METLDLNNNVSAVSRIGLGTWAIGGWKWGGADDKQSIRTIQSAPERGINLIDTAPVYGLGRSEEIIGRAIETGGLRHKVALATKCGLQWDDSGRVVRDASKEHILAEADHSLRRLRTDTIDLLQVHWPGPRVDVRETAEAMQALKTVGKIRAIGVSNFTPQQMDSFSQVATIDVAQNPYNLFERSIENDLLPWARARRTRLFAYGALCRGLLSGRMHAGRTFPGDDLRNDDPKFKPPRFGQYLAAVDALEAFAQDNYSKHVLELAVRWILDEYPASVALWGARTPDQLDAVDNVAEWTLDDEACAQIKRIVEAHVSDPVGPEFMAPPARDDR